MDKISVVIPAREEIFLTKTIKDLLIKAKGEIEIIAVLEGYWPQEFLIKHLDKYDELVDDPRVHYIHFAKPRGMRGAINAGMAIAKGKYVMKCDAHCAFDEGFDEILKADLESNWVVVPRRYSLDTDNWTYYKHPHDYLFLCWPNDPNDFGGPSLKGKDWAIANKDPEKAKLEIDDLMSAQGSCYMMHRDYFHWLELLDEKNYGHFSNEFQEIGNKVWLSGGRIIRNKKTWYAHLHKGRKWGRGWPLGKSVLDKGARFTNKWMDGRNWHKQDRDIRWMVNHFWPVPTWPEESVRFVFHRKRGGSGEIRGRQMAEHFKARINPREWSYDFDVHIWVKQQPSDLTLPGKHYLDVLDEPRRIPWLRQHPECGVISSSQTNHEWLKEKLGRDDIVLIPQHHCNFERVVREREGITTAGVVGGPGAIQIDVEELQKALREVGVSEFLWLKDFSNPEKIVEFYKNLDVQIVWRKQNRPWKNPMKIVNAMSFGIPTIAYPEIAYQEVEGYYWTAKVTRQIKKQINNLRKGFDAQQLIDKAEEYHIDNIAPLYKKLI
jgi:glycosyltransferase involved in cell wall biosynthesis